MFNNSVYTSVSYVYTDLQTPAIIFYTTPSPTTPSPTLESMISDTISVTTSPTIESQRMISDTISVTTIAIVVSLSLITSICGAVICVMYRKSKRKQSNSTTRLRYPGMTANNNAIQVQEVENMFDGIKLNIPQTGKYQLLHTPNITALPYRTTLFGTKSLAEKMSQERQHYICSTTLQKALKSDVRIKFFK